MKHKKKRTVPRPADVGLPALPGLYMQRRWRTTLEGRFSVYPLIHARRAASRHRLPGSALRRLRIGLTFRLVVGHINTPEVAYLINDIIVRLFSPVHSYLGYPLVFTDQLRAQQLNRLTDEEVIAFTPAPQRQSLRNALAKRTETIRAYASPSRAQSGSRAG